MRISDWSSDVCSSDLPAGGRVAAGCCWSGSRPWRGGRCAQRAPASPHPRRSEEHTSELQSLMRISYAVFCLKKKKKKSEKTNKTQKTDFTKHGIKTNTSTLNIQQKRETKEVMIQRTE